MYASLNNTSSSLLNPKTHYELDQVDWSAIEGRRCIPPGYQEYACQLDNTSYSSACDDDLSTSAQPGVRINQDPSERLVHDDRESDDLNSCFSGDSERVEPCLSPSKIQPEDADFTKSHSPSKEFSCPSQLEPDDTIISPPASTETTISNCTSASHRYCYSEDDSMSCEQWNEHIAQQLAPWCDLLLTSQDDTEEQELMDLVQAQFKEDFPHQNEIQRATGTAFLQGLALQQKRHAARLQELQEQHQQQLTMLQQTAAMNREETALPSPERPNKSLRFRYGTPATNRSKAWHGRWKPSSCDGVAALDVNDCDSHTVASVFSTMSCRELSMQRYRRNHHITRTSNIVKTTSQDQPENKPDAEEIQRLLQELQAAETRQKRLEQQLRLAGIVLAEDIPYQEAKDHVERISKRMNEIGSSDIQNNDPVIQKTLQAEYFRLEQEMDKYMNALMLTDEYIAEQKAMEDAWERAVESENNIALQQVRRHMPVAIRKLTRQQLLDLGLPAAMIQKFQRTNVLQLVRRDPERCIARWHPSNLEALRISGLTLTERRALHAHLQPAARSWANKNDPLTERKRTWFQMMRLNFKESLSKYVLHLKETDGETGSNHRCGLLGKQCPVRANLVVDYGGYCLGFPEGDVYEDSSSLSNQDTILPAGAAIDRAGRCRSEERLEPLRLHYKDCPNKLQDVSLALGVCEAMDALMDRMDSQQEEWILQQFQCTITESLGDIELASTAQLLDDLKVGLTSWATRTHGDHATLHPTANDPRSFVEVGLMEEVYETASDYIGELKKRLIVLTDKVNPSYHELKRTIDQLEPLLEKSHSSNLLALSATSTKPPKTRNRKSRTEILASMWKKDCSASFDSSANCLSNSSNLQRRRLPDQLSEKPESIQPKTKVQPETIDRKGGMADQSTGKRASIVKSKAPMSLLAAISARRAEG